MAQKEFKVGNFAKLFNYNVFFGDYLQYISWAVKNSKTVDTLTDRRDGRNSDLDVDIQEPQIFKTSFYDYFC